ncbi:MAG: hypothetical protein ACQGTM_08640 [bacterium]
METLLKAAERPGVDDMAELLKELTSEEQQRIKDFILGVTFSRREATMAEQRAG